MPKVYKIMRSTSSIMLTLLLSIATFAQGNIDLKVKIVNFKNQKGKVVVAIFNSEENYLKKPFRATASPVATKDGTTVHFRIPKGEYAISVYHDENENGNMDRNFMGIPIEPYAFSNNAPSRFGPAEYDAALIEVDEENRVHFIKLN